MPVESIELSGDAIYGIVPNGNGNHRMMMEQMPVRFMLGRNRPRAGPAQALRLDPYIQEMEAMAGALPASTSRRDKCMTSLSRTYLNNQYGDCVFASLMHILGIWSSLDSDSGGVVLATDDEVKKQYFGYTGGRDAGANIADVNRIWQAKGWVAGGKTYKIDGFVSINNTMKEIVKAGIYAFGAIKFGIDLPSEWTQAATWKPTSSRIVGGHDVCGVDYDDQGVYIASWGRIYLITWEAVMSTRWVTELYAMLAPLWYGSDRNTIIGLKADELVADLAKLSQGVVPDFQPPPPDVPLADNVIRITTALGKGQYEGGKIMLGSNLMPGDYEVILQGDGPPPVAG